MPGCQQRADVQLELTCDLLLATACMRSQMCSPGDTSRAILKNKMLDAIPNEREGWSRLSSRSMLNDSDKSVTT